MKAYKVFNFDWTCKGFQYEIGKTYKMPEHEMKYCKIGFHACKLLKDCFQYYECVPWNKIAIVELGGKIIGENNNDKLCCSEITIIEEVPFEDIWKYIKNDLSDGVNRSYAVNESDGVNKSYGVNESDGVNESYGVNKSYGILECSGINESIFCFGKKSYSYIFNTRVEKKRYKEVMKKLLKKLDGWSPTYNNLKLLYLKYGQEWKKTPISLAGEIQKQDAWKDIPKEAVEYLKSLPEFDAKIFEEITGIETK